MPETIEKILQRGACTSKQLQESTGLTQAGVSRRIRAMGNRIIRVKEGRTPEYMMTRNAFGGNDQLPLYMVDAHGNNTAIGTLRPLAHGGFYLEALTGLPKVLLGESKKGLFSDLPFFLFDLAPQGFIGRQIASELSSQSNFPKDPKRWTSEQIGSYLVSNGEDLPGNLKFGKQAHLRVRKKPIPTTPDDYPLMAEHAIQGYIPGSSAGGEQPKFTAFCKERSSHVIVKFSPSGEDPIATRWRDILITEYHASEAIHAKAFPAAETRLIERGGRYFLESKRFDRTGEYGRLPMISLQVVDAEFSGMGEGWPAAMEALHKQKRVSWQHLYDAAVLWCFGMFINNTDMHLGNLSLGIEGDVFRILPVYDMCSMGFAPKVSEVQPYQFKVPNLQSPPLNGNSYPEIINVASEMASDFWDRVARDSRISDDFRKFLKKGNPIKIANEVENGQMKLL